MNAALPPDLTIRSHQGPYVVSFAPAVEAAIAPLRAESRNLFLVDATVRRLHAASFDAIEPERVLVLEATEHNKTLEGVGTVATFLQEAGAGKQSQLVVAGGGIVQDVGAFVAHAYYRGIPYVYVPTTLLAMSDSCIGAKCGVNHGSYKNQLGFFQSPRAVVVATEFLSTLQPSEIRSGLGEILKLALTGGKADFEAFSRHLATEGLGLHEIGALIRRSLATKQAIIEEDEYETGLRKTLNYGHTFGHALETVTDHAVPHGQAVAWGVDIANFFALERGLLDHAIFDEVHALGAKHFAFALPHRLDAPPLIAAMRRDKKASGGTVGLILLRDFGRLEIVPTAFDASFDETMRRYLDRWSRELATA